MTNFRENIQCDNESVEAIKAGLTVGEALCLHDQLCYVIKSLLGCERYVRPFSDAK